MYIKKILYSISLVSATLSCLQSQAQQADSTFVDAAFIIQKDARLASVNPAGLQSLSVTKLSTAALQLQKSDGKFRNYHQSDNSFSWGAFTESYQRLSPAVVVYGKVGYNNFNGKNMAGSAFIDPYKNPFNIVENADSTAGIKKMEAYNLAGAASVALSKKIIAGAKFDFNAANFAKTKDLRHSNKLLDMKASAGLQYAVSNKIQLGATYLYNRRVESVQFQRYGNTDRPYLSVIDFGAFYGRLELFTESISYTEKDNALPLVNNTHTASIDLNIQLNSSLQWHNEFSAGKRKGYYGRRGTSSVVFTEHNADGYQYIGSLNLQRGKNLHSIQAKASFETLNNYENIFSRVTNPGGASSIVYHGQSEVLQQYNSSIGIAYTLYKNISNNNPQWTFKAFADYLNRDITTTIYPFYRTQNINSYMVGLSAKRNIISHNKMYSFSLGSSYGSGNGTAFEDGVYVPPSASQPLPRSRDKYLLEEYEYFTNARISIHPAVQFSMPVQRNIIGYAKIGYQFTKAFNTNYLGSSYGQLNAAIGCNF